MEILEKIDKKAPAIINNVWLNSTAMVLCGLSFGWMIGMSTTPVVREVILGLLMIFIGIMGLTAGIKKVSLKHPDVKDDSFSLGVEESVGWGKYIYEVNFLPIGLFMIFMAVGSGLGVYMRVNYTLIDLPEKQKTEVKMQKARKVITDTTMLNVQLYKGEVEWP